MKIKTLISAAALSFCSLSAMATVPSVQPVVNQAQPNSPAHAQTANKAGMRHVGVSRGQKASNAVTQLPKNTVISAKMPAAKNAAMAKRSAAMPNHLDMLKPNTHDLQILTQIAKAARTLFGLKIDPTSERCDHLNNHQIIITKKSTDT